MSKLTHQIDPSTINKGENADEDKMKNANSAMAKKAAPQKEAAPLKDGEEAKGPSKNELKKLANKEKKKAATAAKKTGEQ